MLWTGAGADPESRGAEIKLPPGTRAAITNCGSASFLLQQTYMVRKEVYNNFIFIDTDLFNTVPGPVPC